MIESVFGRSFLVFFVRVGKETGEAGETGETGETGESASDDGIRACRPE